MVAARILVHISRLIEAPQITCKALGTSIGEAASKELIETPEGERERVAESDLEAQSLLACDHSHQDFSWVVEVAPDGPEVHEGSAAHPTASQSRHPHPWRSW